MEQGFLNYVREKGDPSLDYQYNRDNEIIFFKEHPELEYSGILERSGGKIGEPDKYGYMTPLLVTHETGSWEPWKGKLCDGSEWLKKIKVS